METQLLQVLCCPTCHADLRVTAPRDANGHVTRGLLTCANGHQFPVLSNVPRLLTGQDADADTIRASFAAQWDRFDYSDRTWGATVDQRLQEFLTQVDMTPEELRGKLVLDAGCGNGALSRAISRFGCEVVAVDITTQPVAADTFYRPRPDRETHYLQGDLMRPPLRAGSFDVVFCAGVLHHTPDTRATFDRVVPLVAPGGTVFVWLYHHVPGRLLAVKSRIRERLSRLPAPVKAGVVLGLLPQAMLRQSIRKRRGTLGEREDFTWRERYIVLLDSYTPRYRWEHTQDELAAWYKEAGLVDVRLTEVGPWGFGMCARRP